MFRLVSWLVGSAAVNYSMYTHLRSGSPTVLANGTAICVPDPITDTLHKHGVKQLWAPNIDIDSVLWNVSWAERRENYMASIGDAMRACNVDGMSVDYEWSRYPLGIITANMSNHYTEFLAGIKRATGKIVAADVGVWQYVLGWHPWVNVTRLNRGDIDFISTMSYYWSAEGSLLWYEKDMAVVKSWGMDPARVNIGMPLYSKNGSSQPTWRTLSPHCPNISEHANVCAGVVFVGKNMTGRLAQRVRAEGFGGMFPWAASYDSYKQSIVKYI